MWQHVVLLGSPNRQASPVLRPGRSHFDFGGLIGQDVVLQISLPSRRHPTTFPNPSIVTAGTNPIGKILLHVDGRDTADRPWRKAWMGRVSERKSNVQKAL